MGAKPNPDTRMNVDILFFDGFPSPIQAHERREYDVVLEDGYHGYLSPFIDDLSTGRKKRRRYNTSPETSEDGSQHIFAPPKKIPPPPLPQRWISLAKIGAASTHTLPKRGGPLEKYLQPPPTP